MLDMKIPRKLIIEYVEIKTGKNLKQKDVLNMAASNRMRTEYNEAKSQALFLRITSTYCSLVKKVFYLYTYSFFIYRLHKSEQKYISDENRWNTASLSPNNYGQYD